MNLPGCRYVTAPSAGAMEKVCWSWGAEQAQDLVPRPYVGAVGRCSERGESGEGQFSNGSGFLHARPLWQRHRHSDHTWTSTSPQPPINRSSPAIAQPADFGEGARFASSHAATP